MPRGSARSQPCDRQQALIRIANAEAYIEAAELVLSDDTGMVTPGVAASCAVLAGIAASDAACCAKLRRRHRGDAHREAVSLLAGVAPHGAAMAKDLQRLLDRKDDAQYGLTFLSRADAEKLVRWARRLTETARRVVEA